MKEQIVQLENEKKEVDIKNKNFDISFELKDQ